MLGNMKREIPSQSLLCIIGIRPPTTIMMTICAWQKCPQCTIGVVCCIWIDKKIRLQSGSVESYIDGGLCKKDVTPLITPWSYVFLALPHRYFHPAKPLTYLMWFLIGWCRTNTTWDHFQKMASVDSPMFAFRLSLGDLACFVLWRMTRETIRKSPSGLDFRELDRDSVIIGKVSME